MEFAALLPIATIITVVAAIVLLSMWNKKKNREKLAALSDELGLDFFPKEDPELLDSIGHLRLFKLGHIRSMTNVIVGKTNDIDIAVFEYSYTTGGGKNQRTRRQTVMSFQSTLLNLPDFELRPENVMHKIGKALGFQDINFDSHPDFSKMYLLRGPEEDAVREFFTPELLAYFESQSKISLEVSGNTMVLYRSGRRSKPEKIRDFMEEGFALFQRLTSAEA